MELEIFFAGNKKVNTRLNGFSVKIDQPVKACGDGQGPSPFELFHAYR